jgi:hypothetical protein
MARQTINIGASANDGTGDSLRVGGDKINDTLGELYNYLGGDSDQLPANRIVLHRNDTITTAGAIDTSKDYYIINSGSSLALSLSDGAYTGEKKVFTNRGAGTATITPSNFGPGSSFSLSQNAGCEIIWDSAAWYLISGYPDSDITIA